MISPVQHSYRADIDGLRAVAVLSVVLFHAGLNSFSGGYIGVDIFFVISGYLITGNIAGDIDAGRFSFASFYERRARRILPAFFAMAAVTTSLAMLLESPGDLIQYAKSLIAAVFGVSNMYFRGMAVGSGYFAQHSETQWLLHTWSLGVEEQFYILLPPVLLLLRRFAPKQKFSWLFACALVSLAWAMVTLTYKPNYTFYVVFPRAWELLIGSLLALRAPPAAGVTRSIRELAGLGGLGMILFAVFAFDKTTAFPGANALVPCCGAAAIIWSGTSTDGTRTFVGRVLALPPIVYLGLISYSVYLWHWPVIVFARSITPVDLSWPTIYALVIASLVCGAISYRFVEQPFRRKRVLPTRRAVLIATLVGTASAASFSVIAFTSDGLARRFDQGSASIMAENERRAQETMPDACLNWRKQFEAPADIESCPVHPDGIRKVVFLGDSHVAQLRPVVAKLADEGVFGPRRIDFAIASGCVISPTMNLTDGKSTCPSFARMAYAAINDDAVDTVFIGFSGWFVDTPGTVCLVDSNDKCQRILSPREVTERLVSELAATIQALRDRHKSVVVMLPLPIYDHSVPEVMKKIALFRAIGFSWGASAFETALHEKQLSSIREAMRSIAVSSNAIVYDPSCELCRGGSCKVSVAGVSLYSDGSHFAESQVGFLSDGMRDAFRSAKLHNETASAWTQVKDETGNLASQAGSRALAPSRSPAGNLD